MNRYEPTLLVHPKRGPKIEWIQIECGGYNTIGITKNGDVFSWGEYGFVGGLDGRAITKISCGVSHTAVLTDKGELLTWYV
jgi:alpha-tubulin suppressor-like RCC1 family protein